MKKSTTYLEFSRIKKRKIIFLLISFLPILHCSNLNKKPETDQDFFEKAQGQFKRGLYLEALDTILELKYQFPYSPYSVSGDLLTADVHFDQRDWPMAQKAYRMFIDLYPQHKKVEYAYFRQVLSWNHQIPKIAGRDLSLSDKTIEVVKTFLKKYPKSKWADQVKKIKDEIYQRKIEKELKIAQLYFKKKKYNPALDRLEFLIKEHSQSKWYKQALVLAVKISQKMENKKLEKKYLKKLHSEK